MTGTIRPHVSHFRHGRLSGMIFLNSSDDAITVRNLTFQIDRSLLGHIDQSSARITPESARIQNESTATSGNRVKRAPITNLSSGVHPPDTYNPAPAQSSLTLLAGTSCQRLSGGLEGSSTSPNRNSIVWDRWTSSRPPQPITKKINPRHQALITYFPPCRYGRCKTPHP